ncbi:MAG: glycosyltransferase [Nitrososphaerota archaeon]|nr:glycosyltransferase [Nitrososphaerota archaeon]
MGDGRLPSITVIVPTYNRADSLLRCVSRMPEDIELIVVDDGSTDHTPASMSRCKHPRLKYVRKVNGGPASARNEGVSHSHGEILIFTDDDCVPGDRWVHNLATWLLDEPPTTGGVGGRVLPLGRGWVSRYSTFHRVLEPPSSCSYLVTANCAYRRRVLLQVGGFDETIRFPGDEDPELSFRVRKAGYDLVYEPSAIVVHDYREGLLDFARTFYRYGKGCAHVMA